MLHHAAEAPECQLASRGRKEIIFHMTFEIFHLSFLKVVFGLSGPLMESPLELKGRPKTQDQKAPRPSSKTTNEKFQMSYGK
jgi:hypothetical protein